MSLKTPDAWLEMTVDPWPSGTAAVSRMSDKALAFPTMIEGRVIKGGIGSIEYALSDYRGNPEASTLSVNVTDTDGLIRAFTDSIGRTAYARAETSFKFLSEEGRKAGLTPRVIHRGTLANAPIPGPKRTAKIDTVDMIGSRWYRLNPQATLQSWFVTREHLERCGIVNTPKDSLGKPYPIVLNEWSDHGMVNVNNATAEKGMVPPIDLGDLVFTNSYVVDTTDTNIELVPPPTNVQAVVVGSAGPETYVYAISGIFEGGVETSSSVVAIVTSAPTIRTGSNYIHVTWDIPTGWATYYAQKLIGYRICGRRTNPVTAHLDINRHALGGDGFPDWTSETVSGAPLGRAYNDDDDSDVEKAPAPPAVGTATVVTTTLGNPATITTSSAYGMLCWALGYSELHDVYASNLAEGAVPGRVLLSLDHPDLITPKSTNWPYPNPWIEIGTGDDLIRISVLLVKGVLLDQHRQGTVTFALNVCGATDNGTDTGVPITEASVGFAWVVNQFLLQDKWNGRTPWPLVQYVDGVQVLDIASLAAFQASTVARIGGRGYQMHMCLTKAITGGTFIQGFNTTFSNYSGPNSSMQYGLWTIDNSVSPLSKPHYRQHIEISGPLPEPVIAEDEVENRIRFHFDLDPDTDEWRGDLEEVFDLKSQSIYGIRDAADQESFIELPFTRDRTTARDSMSFRLFHNKVAPIYQPVPLGLLGVEQEMGGICRVTHEDGAGANGYVNRPFFIVRKKIELGSRNPATTLLARDVYRVYSPEIGPAQGLIGLVGRAPGVYTGSLRAILAGSLALTGLAPKIAGSTVIPVGSLALTGLTPSLVIA